MADRIKGITVEIGGDTTGLSKALSGVNKEIKINAVAAEGRQQALEARPDEYHAARTETEAPKTGCLRNEGKAHTAEVRARPDGCWTQKRYRHPAAI
jgi:hypothetical protein